MDESEESIFLHDLPFGRQEREMEEDCHGEKEEFLH